MIELGKSLVRRWQRDEITVLAAGLSFFTMLSLAPLLIVVIGLLGSFGLPAAQTMVLELLRRLLGDNGAELVRDMIAVRSAAADGGWATAIGGAILLVGATGVFTQLQHSFNLIWGVRPKTDRIGLLDLLRMRAVSLGMVLVLGFLLLVSTAFTAAVEALATRADAVLPGAAGLWVALDVVASVLIVLAVLTLIFRYLPDVLVPWRGAAVGAAFTALLFAAGEWGLSLFLGWRGTSDTVSAAGTLIVLMLWVFYSAHIVLLGALLTKVVLRHRGHEFELAPYAEWRDDWTADPPRD